MAEVEIMRQAAGGTGERAYGGRVVSAVSGATMVWLCFVPLLIACWTVGGKRRGLKGFALGWLGGSARSGRAVFLDLRCFAVGGGRVTLVSRVVLGGVRVVLCDMGEVLAGREVQPVVDRFGIDQPGAWTDVLKSLRIAFCTAAVWAGLELLRGWLLTGFGWNGLAVAFHQTPVMAQAADLFGVTGLSMLPVSFQTVLVQTARRMKQSAEDGERRTRLDFLTAAGVVGLVVCYGILRLATEGRGEVTRLKALLVQLNVPQEAARQTWTAQEIHMAYEEETEKALHELAALDEKRLREAMEKSDEGEVTLRWPDWVVWPECALTGRILITNDGVWGTSLDNLETIRRVREAGPFHLLYGINEMEAEEAADGRLDMKPRGRVWNSLAAMDPQDALQTYRKRHLVMFGETIPFVDTIPFLKKLYEMQAGVEYYGSFTPGESLDPLTGEDAQRQAAGRDAECVLRGYRAAVGEEVCPVWAAGAGERDQRRMVQGIRRSGAAFRECEVSRDRVAAADAAQREHRCECRLG